MESAISVKGMGKKYNITHQATTSYVTLRETIAGVFKNPFAFIANKAKKITGKHTQEEFWALKNVNFEVKKGEVVGIIGPNGAGKSTLLKILTGITPPSTGEIRIVGKIASLLEVGTGFHPELSGRENILLNGAILGMTKKQIISKFDEIVEFAGVEKFIDTPVKYYSSGMYVRLAFSVAAHMEPEILLVDEVLAVGDAEFQKKCLGKMAEVTRTAGRTILFVSHNMSAIRSLCKKSVLIEKGQVVMFDDTEKVVDYYLNNKENLQAVTIFEPNSGMPVQITKVSIMDNKGKPSLLLPLSQNFSIDFEFTVTEPIDYTMLAAYFYAGGDLLLFSSDIDSVTEIPHYEPGTYKASITIPAFTFNNGKYSFTIGVIRPNSNLYDKNNDSKKDFQFEILDTENLNRSTILRSYNTGKIGTILKFKVNKAS